MCEADPGNWPGICVDTMNLMAMIEHSLMAAERLLACVVSTHAKDGGLLSEPAGLVTSPAPVAAGVIEPDRVIRMRDNLERRVHLSVEDRGGSFVPPLAEAFAAEQEVPS